MEKMRPTIATVAALAGPGLSTDTTTFISLLHLAIGVIVSTLLRIGWDRLGRESSGTRLRLVVVRVVVARTRVLERILGSGHLTTSRRRTQRVSLLNRRK